MTDKTSKVILKYEVDESSISKVDKATADIVANQQDVNKALQDVTKSAKAAGDALGNTKPVAVLKQVATAAKEARKEAEDYAKFMGQASKIDEKPVAILKRVATATKEARQEAENYAKFMGYATNKTGSASRSGVLTESIGQGSTALGGIASVARGVGGGASGEALGFSGDVLGAVEGIAKLKGEMSGLVKALPEAGGLTGKLASAIGGAGGLTVAAGLGIAAIAGIALAVDNFNKVTAPSRVILEGIIAGQREYYAILQTGTREAIEAKIKELEAQRATDKKIIDENQKIVANAISGMQSNPQIASATQNFVGALIPGLNLLVDTSQVSSAAIGEATKKLVGPAAEAQKALDDATSSYQKNDAMITRLKGSLDAGATAAADAAAAEQKLADARIAQLDADAKYQLERQKLIESGSIKDVIAAQNDNELRQKIAQNEISKLEAMAAMAEHLGKTEELKKYQAELQRYRDQLADLQFRQRDLTNNIKPLIEARDKESKAIRQATDDTKARSDAERQLSDDMHKRQREQTKGEKDAVAEAAQAQQDWFDNLRTFLEEQDKANQEQQKRDEDLVNITKKYTADRTKIEEDALKARADIEGQYADKLVSIAQDAANAAADNLTKLQQAREDITRSTVRDEEKAQRDAAVRAQDIQISAAREDEKSARAHAQRMAQIRQDAQDREADMILNRDFLALFQSRRQTVNDLRNENTGFVNTRQDQQIAAGQQMDDLKRQIANERNERLIAYQQQLQDAQITYQRDIDQANIARQRALEIAENERQNSLAILQQKTAQELAIRQAAAVNEIRLSQMTAQQRNALFTQELAQAQQIQAQFTGALVNTINQARSVLVSAAQRNTSAGILSRAEGGWLGAGQSALVNDAYPGQRESFGGAQFPAGLGIFTPMRGGNVSANSASFANNWNIQGNDPAAIWQFIEPRLKQSILNTLGGL